MSINPDMDAEHFLQFPDGPDFRQRFRKAYVLLDEYAVRWKLWTRDKMADGTPCVNVLVVLNNRQAEIFVPLLKKQCPELKFCFATLLPAHREWIIGHED